MGIDMQCLFTTSCPCLHEHWEGGGGCGLVPISTCGPWISLLYICCLAERVVSTKESKHVPLQLLFYSG